MARSASPSLVTAILALGFGSGCTTPVDDVGTAGPSGGPGGNGGADGSGGATVASGTSSSTTASSGSPTTGASAVATTGAGGGGAFVCDPPAEPGSIYEHSADAFDSPEPLSMCQYRGDVMLIVNTAAA